jgi:hypothetical protein
MTISSLFSQLNNSEIDLGKHGGDRKSERRNQDSDTKVDIKYGENSEYLTARIARDRPDILEEKKEGKHSQRI